MLRAQVILFVALSVSSVASAQTVSYFRASGAPGAIAAGADGNIWFASFEGIGRLTPRGELTTFPISSSANAITAGPNQSMWFARTGGVGRIDKEGSIVTTDIPSIQPTSMATGSDNQLWFGYTGGIGRLTETGAVTLFPLQKQGNRAPDVLDMAAGPDGNVWFVEYPFNQIGRITPNGQITEFVTYPSVCCGPIRIVAGSDGGLWITLNAQRRVARLSTAGVVTQIHEIGNGSVAAPNAITSGPDGRIWFGTESNINGSFLGSVSPSGTVSTIAIPPASDGIRAVTAGPDGNIWATIERIPYGCVTGFCPPQDPTPPLAVARVNLINPAPVITSIERGFDPVTNAPSLKVLGLGFVPDTTIRWNGIDRATIYVSPFELGIPPAEVSQAAYGGTFVVRNAAPGGGASPAFTLKPAASLRRHAAR